MGGGSTCTQGKGSKVRTKDEERTPARHSTQKQTTGFVQEKAGQPTSKFASKLGRGGGRTESTHEESLGAKKGGIYGK